jgi:signal transduction histidine kinase
LQEVIAIVDRAIQQVRNLSLELRPPMLDVLGLEATLRWYVDQQRQRHGLDVQLVGHLETRLAPDLDIVCYRVVQEALTNAVRHARAAHVWVELQHETGELQLIIRDDGLGFDVEAARRRVQSGESFGVQGMQERVELVGARFEIESAPGCGTTVRARIPQTLADGSAPNQAEQLP